MAFRHNFLSNMIYWNVYEPFFLVPPPLHSVVAVTYENKVFNIRIVDLCIPIYLYYFIYTVVLLKYLHHI